MTRSSKINEAFAKGRWRDARMLALRELESDPDNHWLLARASAAYFEERNYGKALEFIKKAHSLAPDCLLVLWDWAGVLLATGKTLKAVDLYEKIIEGALSNQDCPGCHVESKSWALSLVIDCVFMIGVCCQKLKHDEEAARAFLMFIGLRARWTDDCLHTVEEAVARLSSLKKVTSTMIRNEVRSPELLACV